MLHRIIAEYLRARSSHGLKGPDLKKLQDKKVRLLARTIFESVPLYHDFFRDSGLLPEDVKGLEDLGQLPILTRDGIQANFPGRILRTDGNVEEMIHRKTSGTSGTPLEVIWDNKYCDVVAALRMMNVRAIGASHLDRTIEVRYFGPVTDNVDPPDLRRKSKVRRVLIGPLLTPTLLSLRAKTLGFHKSIKEIEEPLSRLRPAAIHCRPSYLRRFGLHLEEEGRRLQIPRIVSSGEYLSKRSREELKETFQADVYDAYGAQELGPLGLECGEHAGIHLISDYFAFEFLRAGERVSPGEAGELIVTALHNETMPLVRYRIGDIVVSEADGRCACGSYLPRIREIQGRPDDGLVLPDGTRMPTGTVVNQIENAFGLRDYQIVQRKSGALLVRLRREQDDPDTSKALGSYFRSLLGADLSIETEVWSEDEMPPKYRPVVSDSSG
jgi:phenylacetate-CoA ligase